VVWEAVKSDGAKIAKFNHWPMPFNYVKNIRTLVCDNQTMLVEIELAFDLAMLFFFTNIFPGPRELERKLLTGGYRCGFYLDVGVKSPVEIIFGEGTARMIAEIARPAAAALFYLWAMQAGFEALSAFTTLIYPMAFCEEDLGDALRRNDNGPIGQGHHTGVPGLGTLIFDHRNFMSLGNASCTIPGGAWHVYSAWIVHPSTTGLQSFSVGYLVNGVPTYMSTPQAIVPGVPHFVTRELQGWNPAGAVVAAYIDGTGYSGAFPVTCECVMFTASFDLAGGPDHYAKDVLPDGPHGSVPPPKCGWLD